MIVNDSMLLFGVCFGTLLLQICGLPEDCSNNRSVGKALLQRQVTPWWFDAFDEFPVKGVVTEGSTVYWRHQSVVRKFLPFVDSVRLGSALVSLMMVDICPAWIIWKKVTCEQLIPWEFHIMTNGLVMFSRNSTSLSTNMIAQLQPQQKIVLNVTFSRHVCSLNWIQLQKTWLWERQWTNTRKIVTWRLTHRKEVSSWKWTLKVLNGRYLLNLTFKHCPTFDNWWSNFMVSNGKIAMQNTSLQWSACTKQAFQVVLWCV